MSLITGLYSYLTSVAGVAVLVGNRIYPSIAPPDADLPQIVYTIVSSQHVRHMQGASDFCERRVQFDAYGSSAEQVEDVFTALRNALEAKRGLIGDSQENVTILSSGIESERDDYIAPIDGSQVAKFRRSIDYTIWHRIQEITP